MKVLQECRVCSSINLDTVWKFRDVPYGDLFKESRQEAMQLLNQPLILVRCQRCQLLQLNQNPDVSEIYSDYLYETKVTVGLNEFYDELASEISDKFSTVSYPDPFIVDIGSNDGTFLKSFSKRGWKCIGVEPASQPAQNANSNSISTINTFFDTNCVLKILDGYGSPNLVTCNYVLANIPDLEGFFRNVVNLMSANSRLHILTGYHPDQFSINMFEYVNHDHITYFTVEDFVRIGKKFGLKVTNASRVEYKGGSVRIEMVLIDSNIEPSPNVAQLLQRERFLRITSLDFVIAFQERLEKLCNDLEEFLEKLGRTHLPGIGASISTTHLISEFKLSRWVNELYDDDVRKTGRFSPGLGLEVFPLTELTNSKTDCVIILAWQHTDKIVSRLKSIGFHGRVVVPLPYVYSIDL